MSDPAAWQRALAALDAALSEAPAVRAGFDLVWRIRVVGDAGVEVQPWIHKIDKRGKPGAGKPVSRRTLVMLHGPKLSTADARAVGAFADDGRWASFALLDALVGHPRVALHDAPDRFVRVERATVGIVAEDRMRAVRVTAGVDGTALPDAMVERLRRVGPEDALYLWDGGVLTLLSVKHELRAALDVLRREGNLFPAESHADLITLLAKWAQRLPVAMPRRVMGRSEPAQLTPVLRFEAEPAGSVLLDIRIRPLAGAATVAPGRGVRDVHVRRGEDAVHAVRDLDREEIAARSFIDELPLDAAGADDDDPFLFRFPDAQGALALLDACARLDPPPELEWVGKPLRVLGAPSPPALRVSVRERREWFGLLGELSVEGERVSLARLLDSARRDQRFVEVIPGDFIELSEALRARLHALLDHTHDTRRGIEIGPSASRALLALAEAGITFDADTTWTDLAHRLTAPAQTAPIPEGLAAELRPYQAAGFRWLAHLTDQGAGAVLADDMGLGKTVQALALLLHRRAQGPALVVAPTSVAFNWQDEAARFAPSLRVLKLGDAADRAAAIRSLGPGDVLLAGYGLLAREHELLAGRSFATIVFDEAHMLKTANAARTRAARMLVSETKIALTGTPVENHLGELWSLFSVVFPSLFGSWPAFHRKFAAPIEKSRDPEARASLVRVLEPFLLRRTKAQVETELPPRTDVRVPVVLSSAEWQMYEDARLAALSDLEVSRATLREQNRKVEVLAALTRLRLLASHPKLYDPRSDLPSSKLARFVALADELTAERERALVFSQFTSHLAFVRDALDARGVPYVYLDGQTPEKLRKEKVAAFQEGTAPFFLISLKAGGFGLNLTAATNVVHLDPWWNPAVEQQATDRAHRLGQTRPVTVYRLIAAGTIEEKMLELHAHKRDLVAQVLGQTDVAVSADDLMSLLGAPSRPVHRP